DDQVGLRALALDQCVDRRGRAVDQLVDRAGLKPALADAVDDALHEVVRRGQALRLQEAAGPVVEADQVGERPPDVDRRYDHAKTLCEALKKRPHSGSGHLAKQSDMRLNTCSQKTISCREGVMISASPRRLTVFKQVVDLGGFNAAASRLGIAQPSVGAHIRALEDRVGQPLFYRHRGARPRLTKAGETLYAFAVEVLRKSEETTDTLADLKASE